MAKDLATRRSWQALLGVTLLAGAAVLQSASAQDSPATARRDAASDASHPGRAIYEQTCGVCHNNPEATRAPALDSLRVMRYQFIDYALTQGKMQAMAAGLSSAQRGTLINYLVGKPQFTDEWMAGMRCKPQRGGSKANIRGAATVAGFGFDLRNQRRLTRAQSGLSSSDFERLELGWAMAFPGAAVMRSQPAVVGSTLFLPVADVSRVFAIDISQPDAPCLKWSYEGSAPLRSAAGFGKLKNGRSVLVFGDLSATVHMVDAATGKGIWQQPAGVSQYSIATGTPVLHEDRVYVPLSQYEISIGAADNHECCKSHGAVVALDAATGKKVWTAHTMPDAKPIQDRGDGKMMWGPSGAPIWTSPAIDTKRGVLYVGTGEATSAPAVDTTDAVLAIDLKDGSIRWRFHATENDVYLNGCGRNRNALNCPKGNTVFRDVDFGASLILAKRADGSDVLLAGQKSGTLWALDPDQQGKVLWQRDFGEGSALGGIHWGIASDGERVFAPINRPYPRPAAPGEDRPHKPGLNTVRIETGELLWSYTSVANCNGERQTRLRNCANTIGFSGAPTVIDSVVVQGSLDGFLRAFDTVSGKLLFEFDTARPYDTVNGVPGNGGSIDNGTIVAANGYLFVPSGYGLFGETPGNVLLAFRAKAAPKTEAARTVRRE